MLIHFKNPYSLYIILWFFFSTTCLVAQTPEVISATEDTDALIEKANLLMDKNDYKGALPLYNKAIRHRLQKDSLNTLALGKDYLQKHFCVLNLGDYKGALALTDTALSYFFNTTPTPHLEISSTYRAQSFAWSQLGNYTNAIESANQALSSLKKAKDKDIIVENKIYNVIAVANFYKQDFDQAILYLQKAISNIKKNLGNDHPQLGPYYSNIAINYTKVGDYKNADLYYDAATRLFLKLKGEDHPGLHHVNFNRGMNAYSLGNINKGIQFLQKSLKMRLKMLGPEHPLVGHCYQIIGNGWMELEEYEKALGFHKKGLQIELKARGIKNPETARNYAAVGESYKQLGDFEKAAIYFDSAYLSINYDLTKPDNLESVLLLPTLLDIAEKDAELSLSKFEKLGKSRYLEEGREKVNRCIHIIDYAKSTFKEEGAKLVFTNAARPAISIGMEILYQLYKSSGDEALLNEMWQLTERSKNYLLLEALLQSKAKAYAGLPDSILHQEKKLKESITDLEKAIFQEEKRELSVENEKLIALKGELLDHKMAYDNWLAKVNEVAPKYYKARYGGKLLDLNDLQKLLPAEQTCVSYHIGNQSIFAITVNKEIINLNRLPLDFELVNWIDSLRLGVFQYHIQPEKSPASYKEWNEIYSKYAFQLHQKLVAPVKAHWKSEVMILASDELGYLPFELLLSSKPDDPNNFNTHGFLIRDFTISYNYSGTLWWEMVTQKTSAKDQVLAIAPTFSEKEGATELAEYRRSNLGPLLHNEQEVKAIMEYLSGNLLLGREATKEAFLNQLSDHSIIHIATHGKLEDRQPDFSFLALSSKTDSLDYEPLYIRQVYNLNIPAKLVVLSACETGLGKLYRGEGIISLARGFSFAGAKSIVPTFWSVNDAAMAGLMEKFYANLSKGMTKNQALHQAKLAFLEGKDPFQSAPYFWASPIIIGDISPLSGSNSYGWVWWLSGLFTLLGALVMYRWLAGKKRGYTTSDIFNV